MRGSSILLDWGQWPDSAGGDGFMLGGAEPIHFMHWLLSGEGGGQVLSLYSG